MRGSGQGRGKMAGCGLFVSYFWFFFSRLGEFAVVNFIEVFRLDHFHINVFLSIPENLGFLDRLNALDILIFLDDSGFIRFFPAQGVVVDSGQLYH